MAVTTSDKQWEFLQDVAKLIQFAKEKGFKLTGGELYRPYPMQILYYLGRSLELIGNTIKIVDAQKLSKTLDSLHGNRLAIDFNIFYDVDGDGHKDYDIPKAISRELGDYWESLNPKNVWGGSWGWDMPHFERKL